MSDNTPLGDRMKQYETAFRQMLPRRAYTLIRCDGRAFHTYLRGAKKPFDMDFVAEMALVTQRLCEDIQGAQFAYTQSDEISLLLTDFETTRTQPWVGGRADKTLSLASGLASAYLARLRQNHPGLPVFDCRVWSMSDPVEVANYFVWRQRDCVRNSILATGQHHFSHAELQGKSTSEVQEMLFTQKGVNWNDTPASCKRGQVAVRDPEEGWLTFAAPHFRAEPHTFLAGCIPQLPSLTDEEEAQ